MKNKELWTETKFIKIKQHYEASMNPNDVSVGSRLIVSIQADLYYRVIQEHARGLLLDLGCGYVPCYDMYRSYVTDNICIDWSHTSHKNSSLDHEFDLNQAIPLNGEQFDTILATDVLEHISHPNLLMSEMARLLKPGGKLILTVPFLYWIHESPHDYFRYTQFALRKFCDENSLTIVALEPYGGAPEVVLDILSKLIARFSALSAISFALSRRFIRSSFGKKISQKTCDRFPLGYCLVAQK